LLWSKSFGGTWADSVRDLEVAPSGDIYLTGVFTGSLVLGTDTLVGGSGLNAFLTRLDETGNPVWARGFFSQSHHESWNHVRVAPDGVYLAGVFTGRVDFGGGAVVGTAPNTAFLVKYDFAGGHLWTRTFGSLGSHAITGLGLNEAGGVTVAGYFAEQIDVEGVIHSAKGDEDVFMASYTAGGQRRWSRSYGSTGEEIVEGVSVGPDGRVLLHVSVRGESDLGTGPFPSTTINDVAIALYDPDGLPIWAKRFGDAKQRANNARISRDGSLLVSGINVGGSLDFGGGALTGYGDYLARFSASGEHLRSVLFSQGTDHAAVAEDSQGDVFVTGGIRAPADFGGQILPNLGGQDIFVLKLDADFNPLWAFHAGSNLDDFPIRSALTPLGRVVIAGAYQSTLLIGPDSHTSNGDFDFYLGMLSP